MKIFNISLYKSAALLLAITGITSCKKFVELPLPASQVVTAAVFADSTSLNAALGGIYSSLGSNTGTATTVFTASAMFADEVISKITYGNDAYAVTNTYTADQDFGYFSYYYFAIYQANALLEGIDNAPNISASQVKQVKGECLFLRAYCHFNLTNFYGTIPVITTTDVSKTQFAPNSPIDDIYASIFADLQTAGTLLTDGYPAPLRTQANLETVHALQAKAYLYHKDWSKAISAANAVIGSGLYSLTPDLNQVASNTSNETIWQFWNQAGYCLGGSGYIPGNTASPNYPVRPELVNAFAANDKRFTSWFGACTGAAAGQYYPFKYQVKGTTVGKAEYLINFRLAEMYLIRAEALTQQNNLPDAITDIETIRSRAGLTDPLTITAQTQLLDTIAQERRRELVFENAHRWFDLKRTDKAVAVLSAIKPTFKPNAVLLPFPRAATNANYNLKPNP